MSTRRKSFTSMIALLMAFAISQIYLGVSLAGPAASATDSPAVPAPQQVSAILSTRNNQPVSVNGASAVSGATILTGASIDTPDQYGAVVDVPRHGKLEISPRTKLTMDFDAQGIKITLIHGCVTLHTKKGTTGLVVTSNGAELGKADGSKDAVITVCDPTTAAAPAATAGGGLAKWKIAAIIAGGATAVIIPIARGGNPSPR